MKEAIKMSKKILFINASQNREGNTVRLAKKLLGDANYEQLNLVDYKIYQIGQNYPDDQFEEVLDKMRSSNLIIFGTPQYWHEMSGYLKTLIEKIGQTNDSTILKGIDDALIMQGAFPGDGVKETNAILKRWSSLAGMNYLGYANTSLNLGKLRKHLNI